MMGELNQENNLMKYVCLRQDSILSASFIHLRIDTTRSGSFFSADLLVSLATDLLFIVSPLLFGSSPFP